MPAGTGSPASALSLSPLHNSWLGLLFSLVAKSTSFISVPSSNLVGAQDTGDYSGWIRELHPPDLSLQFRAAAPPCPGSSPLSGSPSSPLEPKITIYFKRPERHLGQAEGARGPQRGAKGRGGGDGDTQVLPPILLKEQGPSFRGRASCRDNCFLTAVSHLHPFSPSKPHLAPGSCSSKTESNPWALCSPRRKVQLQLGKPGVGWVGWGEKRAGGGDHRVFSIEARLGTTARASPTHPQLQVLQAPPGGGWARPALRAFSSFCS